MIEGMKRFFLHRFIGLLALTFIGYTAFAQDLESYDSNPKKDWKDKFYFGGNVGAQFGTFTFVNLAPLVGYKITDRFSIGTQIQYQYFRDNSIATFESHVFGYSGFARYFFTENLFAHTEYQVLNGRFDYSGKRVNIPNLFIGGGYMYPISDNVSFGIVALYEVLRRTYSPYRNPTINVGVNIGL